MQRHLRTSEGAARLPWRHEEPADETGSYAVEERDLEAVTHAARRLAFEAGGTLSFLASAEAEPRLLETLARAVVEPRGEVFEGECEALMELLTLPKETPSRTLQSLCQAAIEVARDGCDGTAAARTELLRAVASFLLHDRCTRVAAATGGGGTDRGRRF